jgi:hypothetical protein
MRQPHFGLKLLVMGAVLSTGVYADISVTNPGFEAPGLAPGGYLYFANCQISTCSSTVDGWTYTNDGVAHGGSGIASNGSAFTIDNANAPEGTQVLFLQDNSSAAQSLSGFQSGVRYTLSFYLSNRQNVNEGPGAQTLDVKLGSQNLATDLVPTAGPGYTLETLTFTNNGPSTQTLTFETTQFADDRTFFVDDVQITPEPGYLVILIAGLAGLFVFRKYSVFAKK